MSNVQGPQTPVARPLAMEAKKMVIEIPHISSRTWKTLDEIKKVYNEQEIVQIVHRYCDSQDHAKNYRQRAKSKVDAMKAALTEAGIDIDSL